jgi:hypothetical protein
MNGITVGSRAQASELAARTIGPELGHDDGGARSCSMRVPSLFELETRARRMAALRRISTKASGGTTSQASWL